MHLKVGNASQQNGLLAVQVDNIGGFAIPFDAEILYEDGTLEKLHFSPSVWEKDQKKTMLTVPVAKKAKSVSLDGGIFMDYTPEDNRKNL